MIRPSLMKRTWQITLSQSIKTLQQLKEALSQERALAKSLPLNFPEKTYPILIPRPFLKKMLNSPPLWKQFIPQEEEVAKWGFKDPIGDQTHQKTKQLIHRYENRALFIPTSTCPIHCRYCFRKNELPVKNQIFYSDFKNTLAYLTKHGEIEEIIFTGGDPLVLNDSKLDFYLREFSKIPHIKIIRFHSRMPVIIPERIDQSFIHTLKSYENRFHLALMIHINHPDEWSDELEKNIQALKSFCSLFSQTVLLKDVNDSPQTLSSLFKTLSLSHIIPYYLHHPDQAQGSLHFSLPLEEGRRIYAQLRRSLSGWMLPQYIIDIPQGYGKTPAFNPETYQFSGRLIDLKGEVQKIDNL